MEKTLRLALGLAFVACNSSVDSVSSDEDDIRKLPQPTPQEVEALFRAVDDNCAGNDNGGLRRFDVATFNAAVAIQKLRVDDKDAMGVDCSDQHEYSTSRESGVKLFEDHVNDELESTKSCLAENLTTAQRTRLRQIVSDPANLGVFASSYSGGDNPEGCSYYTFQIYRKDGTLLELRFNFTD